MNKKEIEQLVQNFTEKTYDKGYDDGHAEGYCKGIKTIEEKKKESYQEGLNDAWECFKKLVYPVKDGGLSTEELRRILGVSLPSKIIREHSPSEAIQKIKDYEEKKKQADAEISVGDEVMVNDIDRKAVVIGISTFNDWDAPYNILFENGNTDWVRKDIISKTGKHYSQIEEVLKELRGDEE